MRPGAVMGAATPVDGEGRRAPEKMVSAMRAEFRAVAEERGLDPRIAEAMVDEAIEIPGLDRKGELLTLTSGEARKVGYAKGEVADEAALAPGDRAARRAGDRDRPQLGRAGGPLPHQPAGVPAAAVARRAGARAGDQERRVRPRRAGQPRLARPLLRLQLPARARRLGGSAAAGPRADRAGGRGLRAPRLRRRRHPRARRDRRRHGAGADGRGAHQRRGRSRRSRSWARAW